MIAFIPLCILTAFIACTSSALWEIPVNLCSLSGECVANVTGLGHVSCSMKRVRNFVRYDFYHASSQQVAASLLVRPDLNDTFFTMESSCVSLGRPLSMTHYEKNEDDSIYTYSSFATMIFDEHDSLAIERFRGIPGDVEIDIEYKTVSYDYFNDSYYFRIINENCPEAASQSTDALSSVQCGDKSIYKLCSFTGVGTATVNGYNYLLYAKVVHVDGYARYDMYVDSQMEQPVYASLIIRPDLGKAFIYDSSVAVSCNSDVFSSLNYKYNETIKGLDIYSVKGAENLRMMVTPDTHDIVMETIPFFNTESGEIGMITITYQSTDYDYVHDEADDLFSLKNEYCPDAASNATAFSSNCPMLLSPVFPGCAFEYDFVQKPEAYHVKLIAKSPEFGFGAFTVNGDLRMCLRCDVRSIYGHCLMIENPGKAQCREGYVNFGFGAGLFEEDYTGEPRTVDCPDGTTGCKKYSTTYFDYVVDQEGRYVSSNSFNISYTSGTPSVDDFICTRCNGDILNAPIDFCPRDSSSSFSSSEISSSSSSDEKEQQIVTEWWVEIEMEQGIKAANVNATAILEAISVQSGLDVNDIGVRFETDENGFLVRVIVYAKNEEAVTSVSNTLNEMNKGDSCQYGILCRSKSITVHSPERTISGASFLKGSVLFPSLVLLMQLL